MSPVQIHPSDEVEVVLGVNEPDEISNTKRPVSKLIIEHNSTPSC